MELRVDEKAVKWDYDPDYWRFDILRHNLSCSKGAHRIELLFEDRAGNEMKKLTSGYTVK